MYRVYQVEQNDTIEQIANKFGITPNELISINSFTSISPGQFIVVPTNKVFDTYIVKKGDNAYEIARKYNIDLNSLLKLNGLDKDDYIYPDQELLIPRNNLTVYITEENDTIKNVLDKLNLSINELLEENKELYLVADQLIVKTK